MKKEDIKVLTLPEYFKFLEEFFKENTDHL